MFFYIKYGYNKARRGDDMQNYPKFLRDFLIYLTTIKGKSKRTREEYEYDLVLFFRFHLCMQQDLPLETLDNVSIRDIAVDDVRDITLEDLYVFLEYCEEVRHNSASSRARKVATLRAFFKYMRGKRKLIDDNPAEELESPKQVKRRPIYLKVDEAQSLLQATKSGSHYERNHCIITFFLHLGLRVSELCNLNMSSLQGDRLRIIGKGNKERIVFCNDICLEALHAYKAVRTPYKGDEVDEPLFTSQKGTRLTRQRIAKMLKAVSDNAELTKGGITPHKLRHTSATLMYQAGADIRSLQHILGHSSVATTQIYTHIEDDSIRDVLAKNPLNKK